MRPLLAARNRAEQRQVAAQIEAGSAAWGEVISAMPTPAGTRARRDAYCRAQRA